MEKRIIVEVVDGRNGLFADPVTDLFTQVDEQGWRGRRTSEVGIATHDC